MLSVPRSISELAWQVKRDKRVLNVLLALAREAKKSKAARLYTRELLARIPSYGEGHRAIKRAEMLGLIIRWKAFDTSAQRWVVYNELTDLGWEVLRELGYIDEKGEIKA